MPTQTSRMPCTYCGMRSKGADSAECQGCRRLKVAVELEEEIESRENLTLISLAGTQGQVNFGRIVRARMLHEALEMVDRASQELRQAEEKGIATKTDRQVVEQMEFVVKTMSGFTQPKWWIDKRDWEIMRPAGSYETPGLMSSGIQATNPSLWRKVLKEREKRGFKEELEKGLPLDTNDPPGTRPKGSDNAKSFW